jgi:hypothetical protein
LPCLVLFCLLCVSLRGFDQYIACFSYLSHRCCLKDILHITYWGKQGSATAIHSAIGGIHKVNTPRRKLPEGRVFVLLPQSLVRFSFFAHVLDLTWGRTPDLLRSCQRQWSTAVPAALKWDTACDPRPAVGSNRPLGRELGNGAVQDNAEYGILTKVLAVRRTA